MDDLSSEDVGPASGRRGGALGAVAAGPPWRRLMPEGARNVQPGRRGLGGRREEAGFGGFRAALSAAAAA